MGGIVQPAVGGNIIVNNQQPARQGAQAQNVNHQVRDAFVPLNRNEPQNRAPEAEDKSFFSKLKSWFKKDGVDILSDIFSGIVAFSAYTIAVGALALAPFTGGSSLLITAGALSVAGLVGGTSKVIFKSICSRVTGEKYESAKYDFLTGAFAGVLAPITSAFGSAAARFIGSKLGVKAVSHAIGKGLTTEFELVGGRFVSRFAIRGTQMAAEGAFAGSLDNSFRHICKNGSLDGAGDAFKEGLLGGLILSPAIGGSLRGVGKLAKKLKSTNDSVREAIAKGKSDLKNIPVLSQDGGPLSKLKEPVIQAVENPQQAIVRISKNKRLQKRTSELASYNSPEIQKVVKSKAFQNGDQQTRAKLLMERSITAGKMAQILADDPRIEQKTRDFFVGFKSNNSPTRNLRQAQSFSNRVYGDGKYTIIKSLGVGTVGESYLARTTDGTQVVVKMLKRRATPGKLLRERRVLRETIKANSKISPEEKRYLLGVVDNYYKGWIQELNLATEANAAKMLASGAKRYKVAQPIEVGFPKKLNGQTGKRATSLVLEMAEGIRLDDLMKMLEIYKANPKLYSKQFADEIKKHPWLANPITWLDQLPNTYLRAQNEQSLYSVFWGRRLTHGDPHAGNVFIHFNNNQLGITYIDTGLVVVRKNKAVINNLGSCLDFIIGNSREFAKRIINTAQKLPPGKTKRELIRELTETLDKELFKKGINLTNPHYTQNTLNSILERIGIIDSPVQALFYKSQMQTVLHYLELSRLAGQNNNMLKNSLGDIMLALGKGFIRNPFYTTWSIFPSIFRGVCNLPHSVRNLTQFLT